MTAREDVQQIDLTAEMARFPPEVPSGRRAEILLKTPTLRLVLITMRAGIELNEHAAPGPIAVQPLQGRFAFTAGDEEHEIGVGELVTAAGGVRHTVRALADGAFLLTIAWPGDETPSLKE